MSQFNAGQGRIEIIGLTNQAVNQLDQVSRKVDEINRKAAKQVPTPGGGPKQDQQSGGVPNLLKSFIKKVPGGEKALGFIESFGAIAALRAGVVAASYAIVKLIEHFQDLREQARQAEEDFENMANRSIESVQNAVRGTGSGIDGFLTKYEEAMASIRKTTSTELDSLREETQRRLKELGEMPGWTRWYQGMIGGQTMESIRENAEKADDLIRRNSIAATSRIASNRVLELKEEARVASKEMLLSWEKVDVELAEKLREFQEIREKGIDDAKRKELDAAEEVFRRVADFRKMRRPAVVGLGEMARRFDTAPMNIDPAVRAIDALHRTIRSSSITEPLIRY